jgi:hypothetical protein
MRTSRLLFPHGEHEQAEQRGSSGLVLRLVSLASIGSF